MVAQLSGCAFCDNSKRTREHVFRRAWGERFNIVPGFSWYARWNTHDGANVTRSADFFDMQVRRACGECNSVWMNALDTHSEKWLFAEDSAAYYIDEDHTTDMFRWAVKVAVMRLLYEGQPLPDDMWDGLREGTPSDWYVFVGRLDVSTLYHATSGWTMEIDHRKSVGVKQVTFVIHSAVVFAMWAPEIPGAPDQIIDVFRDTVRNHQDSLVEVRPGANVDLRRSPALQAQLLPVLPHSRSTPNRRWLTRALVTVVRGRNFLVFTIMVGWTAGMSSNL